MLRAIAGVECPKALRTLRRVDESWKQDCKMRDMCLDEKHPILSGYRVWILSVLKVDGSRL